LDQILEDIKQFRNLSTSSPNPPSRKGEGWREIILKEVEMPLIEWCQLS
jgi:hypothetical protein